MIAPLIPPMRKPYRRKDARPGELLDAALSLFLEHGYAATRLEDVARLAQAGKGTVCAYFPTKEALFAAVIRESLVPLVSIRPSLPTAASERLRNILRLLASNLTDPRRGGIPRLVAAEAGNFPELAQLYQSEVITPTLTVVAAVIADGVVRGEFRPVDATVQARLALAPVLFQVVWGRHLDAPGAAGIELSTFLDAHMDGLLRSLAPVAIEQPCSVTA